MDSIIDSSYSYIRKYQKKKRGCLQITRGRIVHDPVIPSLILSGPLTECLMVEFSSVVVEIVPILIRIGLHSTVGSQKISVLSSRRGFTSFLFWDRCTDFVLQCLTYRHER